MPDPAGTRGDLERAPRSLSPRMRFPCSSLGGSQARLNLTIAVPFRDPPFTIRESEAFGRCRARESLAARGASSNGRDGGALWTG